MLIPRKNNNVVCYNGQTDCYYESHNPFQRWGRWVLLAALVAAIIICVFLAGWLMSLRRMRSGLPPVPGFAWMFPNPYKNQSRKELEASRDFEAGDVQYPYYQASSDFNSERDERKI